MATIRTTCPNCGPVARTTHEVHLRVDARNTADATYRFHCPHCDRHVVSPRISWAQVHDAKDAGVDCEYFWQPDPDAPQFTNTDAAEFRSLLDDDEATQRRLEQIAKAVGS